MKEAMEKAMDKMGIKKSHDKEPKLHEKLQVPDAGEEEHARQKPNRDDLNPPVSDDLAKDHGKKKEKHEEEK